MYVPTRRIRIASEHQQERPSDSFHSLQFATLRLWCLAKRALGRTCLSRRAKLSTNCCSLSSRAARVALPARTTIPDAKRITRMENSDSSSVRSKRDDVGAAPVQSRVNTIPVATEIKVVPNANGANSINIVHTEQPITDPSTQTLVQNTYISSGLQVEPSDSPEASPTLHPQSITVSPTATMAIHATASSISDCQVDVQRSLLIPCTILSCTTFILAVALAITWFFVARRSSYRNRMRFLDETDVLNVRQSKQVERYLTMVLVSLCHRLWILTSYPLHQPHHMPVPPTVTGHPDIHKCGYTTTENSAIFSEGTLLFFILTYLSS
jgi:hypothetical protein